DNRVVKSRVHNRRLCQELDYGESRFDDLLHAFWNKHERRELDWVTKHRGHRVRDCEDGQTGSAGLFDVLRRANAEMVVSERAVTRHHLRGEDTLRDSPVCGAADRDRLGFHLYI